MSTMPAPASAELARWETVLDEFERALDRVERHLDQAERSGDADNIPPLFVPPDSLSGIPLGLIERARALASRNDDLITRVRVRSERTRPAAPRRTPHRRSGSSAVARFDRLA